LTGNTDIEDRLERLDKLTLEEVQMASAELLKMTHCIDDKVMNVDDRVIGGYKMYTVQDTFAVTFKMLATRFKVLMTRHCRRSKTCPARSRRHQIQVDRSISLSHLLIVPSAQTPHREPAQR
jgi:hypothetical protein